MPMSRSLLYTALGPWLSLAELSNFAEFLMLGFFSSAMPEMTEFRMPAFS
jgi:hypothetical protein